MHLRLRMMHVVEKLILNSAIPTEWECHFERSEKSYDPSILSGHGFLVKFPHLCSGHASKSTITR